jgi:uncharacterized protein (TIGR02145 family)
MPALRKIGFSSQPSTTGDNNMRNTISIAAATLAFAITLTLSCSGGDDNGGGNPSSDSGGGISSSGDGGDGSSSSSGGGVTGGKGNDIANYNTVPIGGQVWMAENLDYAVDGSKCFYDDPANCAIYGRLYDWATANTVCPTGWHLPSDAEWDALIAAAGGEDTAGTKLKAASDLWERNGKGTDDYGFAALPGGGGNPAGGFGGVGYNGNWWSASEGGVNDAYDRYMNDLSNVVNRNINGKSYLRSVRCVKDN